MCLPFRSVRSTGILEFLCDRNPVLESKIAPLLGVLKLAALCEQSLETTTEGEASGFESQLEVMQQRLVDVQALVVDAQQHEEAATAVKPSEGMVQIALSEQHNMPTGWRLADSSWKPTPFGCLDGKIPDLMV